MTEIVRSLESTRMWHQVIVIAGRTYSKPSSCPSRDPRDNTQSSIQGRGPSLIALFSPRLLLNPVASIRTESRLLSRTLRTSSISCSFWMRSFLLPPSHTGIVPCLCLLFIHPRAPNLINIRSAGNSYSPYLYLPRQPPTLPPCSNRPRTGFRDCLTGVDLMVRVHETSAQHRPPRNRYGVVDTPPMPSTTSRSSGMARRS